MQKEILYEIPTVLLIPISDRDIITSSKEEEWKDENTNDDGWV